MQAGSSNRAAGAQSMPRVRRIAANARASPVIRSARSAITAPVRTPRPRRGRDCVAAHRRVDGDLQVLRIRRGMFVHDDEIHTQPLPAAEHSCARTLADLARCHRPSIAQQDDRQVALWRWRAASSPGPEPSAARDRPDGAPRRRSAHTIAAASRWKSAPRST